MNFKDSVTLKGYMVNIPIYHVGIRLGHGRWRQLHVSFGPSVPFAKVLRSEGAPGAYGVQGLVKAPSAALRPSGCADGDTQTLRVKNAQIWSIYGFSIRNRNYG